MNFNERAQKIMSMLHENGIVNAVELSRQLEVSVITIRKDLQKMEDMGKVSRVFGGAILKSTDSAEEDRMVNLQRIAQRAALEIKDGDCLIMNAGNTTLLTARNILHLHQLKVITNSISIARELCQRENIQLIFLGGEVNSDAVFTYGRDAIAQIQQYKANKLIISPNGISCSRGLTTRYMSATDLLQKMIERTEEVIVVADDKKLGFESFYHVDDINAITKIITNTSQDSQRELEQMAQLGIEVIQC